MVSYLAAEILTGSYALYKWDVIVDPIVMDEKNNTQLVNIDLMYSMFDLNKYKEATVKNKKYVIRMEYCRGEGFITLFFSGETKPQAQFYTFKVSSSGYEPKLIPGKVAKNINMVFCQVTKG